MPALIQANHVSPVALNFMDQEHLHEIDLINRLYELLQPGRVPAATDAEVTECLARLADDLVTHFEHEQGLMQQLGYPDAELHGQRHDAVVEQLEQARTVYAGDANRGRLREFLAEEFKDSFVKHLTTEDYRLAQYCRQQR